MNEDDNTGNAKGDVNMLTFKKARDEANPIPDHATKGFKGSQWKQGTNWAYEWTLERQQAKHARALDAWERSQDKLYNLTKEASALRNEVKTLRANNEALKSEADFLAEALETYANSPYTRHYVKYAEGVDPCSLTEFALTRWRKFKDGKI